MSQSGSTQEPRGRVSKNKVILFCKHGSDWHHVCRLIVHETNNSEDLPLLSIVFHFYFLPFTFANIIVQFIFHYAITGFEYVSNTEPQP